MVASDLHDRQVEHARLAAELTAQPASPAKEEALRDLWARHLQLLADFKNEKLRLFAALAEAKQAILAAVMAQPNGQPDVEARLLAEIAELGVQSAEETAARDDQLAQLAAYHDAQRRLSEVKAEQDRLAAQNADVVAQSPAHVRARYAELEAQQAQRRALEPAPMSILAELAVQLAEVEERTELARTLCADAEAQIAELEAVAAREPRRRPSIPQAVKDAVWNRDGGRCVDCGTNENLEFDHIIPFAKGGAHTYRNLQLLCETCNRRKGATLG